MFCLGNIYPKTLQLKKILKLTTFKPAKIAKGKVFLIFFKTKTNLFI